MPRILFRDGVPLDKPVWITSDIYQSEYIGSREFADRCSRELGYGPLRKLTRLSPNDLEWLPDYGASLVLDPRSAQSVAKEPTLSGKNEESMEGSCRFSSSAAQPSAYTVRRQTQKTSWQ